MLRAPVFLLALAVAAATGGAALAAGSPKGGKVVFAANGCGACHAFAPAGAKGTIGPPLTRARLAADAKAAKQPLATFVRTSVTAPAAFIAKGYKAGLMPTYTKLTAKQLDDLVAFLQTG